MIHRDEGSEFISQKDITAALEKLQPGINRACKAAEHSASIKELLSEAITPWIMVVWQKFQFDLVESFPGSHGILKRDTEGARIPYSKADFLALFDEQRIEGIIAGLNEIQDAALESFRHICGKINVFTSHGSIHPDSPFTEEQYLRVMDLMSLDPVRSSLDGPAALIYEGLDTATKATFWMMRQIAFSLNEQDVTEFFSESVTPEDFVNKVYRNSFRFIRYLSTMRYTQFTGIGSMWILGINDMPIFWIDGDASLYTKRNFVNRTFEELALASERSLKADTEDRLTCPMHAAGIAESVFTWARLIFEDLLLEPLVQIAQEPGKMPDPRRKELRRMPAI